MIDVINVPASDAEKLCSGNTWFELVEILNNYPYWFNDETGEEIAVYICKDGSQILSKEGEHVPLPFVWSKEQLIDQGFELEPSTNAVIAWANSYR